MPCVNAHELLLHLTRKQVANTFAAARKLPPNRLEWRPGPGARTALDQLQEFATAMDVTWDVYQSRKLSWSKEVNKAWMEKRSQITDIDELERIANANIDKLAGFLAEFDPADYAERIEVPFSKDYTMADCLALHFWNGAYHEGQINYIASLLPSEEDQTAS